MITELNIRYFSILLLISVVALVSYYAGLLETHFDLVAESHSRSVTGDSATITDIDGAENGTGAVIVECQLEKKDNCGLAVVLSRDKTLGYDLSKYKYVDVKLRYTSPEAHKHLNLYIKNFNAKYASADDALSLKYNTISLSPSQSFSKLTIPLENLYVASWWISRRNISYSNAGVDITNVSTIQLSTGSAKVDGFYKIEVESFYLRGELISEKTLFKTIFIIWIVTIIFLLNHVRRSITNISRQDSLTGIYNRRGLEFWLSKNYDVEKNDIIIYYIDIDDFKRVNDAYGHFNGDQLIKGFCNNIHRALQDISTNQGNKIYNCFARMSGDEFVIIFKKFRKANAEWAAFSLLKHISDPIKIDGKEIKVNASIGVSIKCSYSISWDTLMLNADSAMYIAKRRGKNQYQVFNDQIQDDIENERVIASAITHAIENELFYLEYMPIYSGSSLKIIGAEALIRCTSEKLEGITPDIYIPIAESHGMIRAIDTWVVNQVFKDIASVGPEFRISYNINISSVHLHSKGFLASLSYLLKTYDINPENIVFEITETNLVALDQQSVTFLNEIRSLGFCIALDDFGTGYTAFAQLLEYPVQYLKVDKSFVDLIDNKENDKSVMVDSILAIAKSYGLKVVAEGVETESQIQYLQSLECDCLQGYYLSKSIPWKKLVSKTSSGPVLKQIGVKP